MTSGANAELRIVHVLPITASEETAALARDRLEAELRRITVREYDGESGVTIRICRGEPAAAILGQAERFGPDLIVLGAHGEPRLRDAIFGTTAGRIVREARQPVLIAQNDPEQPYRNVMVAIDMESAGRVLDLALSFASPDQVHVVHAFGSVLQSLAGGTDLLEDVRTDQDVLAAAVRKKLSMSGRPAPRIENIVQEGDEMEVIMRAWDKVRPDLVVMGTHGRTGIAHLLHGSLAESVLLGCPSDMLIMRTSADGLRSADPRPSRP
jgi:nucleotide-binding universal stress UspA family protein